LYGRVKAALEARSFAAADRVESAGWAGPVELNRLPAQHKA